MITQVTNSTTVSLADGSVQDCGNSRADALEVPQCCTEPSIIDGLMEGESNSKCYCTEVITALHWAIVMISTLPHSEKHTSVAPNITDTCNHDCITAYIPHLFLYLLLVDTDSHSVLLPLRGGGVLNTEAASPVQPRLPGAYTNKPVYQIWHNSSRHLP